MACFQNVTHLVDNHILQALRSFLIKSQIDVDMMCFYIAGAPARFHLTDCNTGYLHLHQWFILLDQLFYRCLQKYFSASDLLPHSKPVLNHSAVLVPYIFSDIP